MLLGRGRFVIHRKLGAGGMGVVYEAVDRERGATVALKTLQQASPNAVARLKREFRSLADVIHPNLVSLYELYADGDEIFFTMELVEGEHFSRFVRPASEDEPLQPSESLAFTQRTAQLGAPRLRAISYDPPTEPGAALAPPRSLDVGRLRLALRQLAEGVSAIHDAGLLHRDLKPSNVLVTTSGRVVILDFGLASALADEKLAGDDRPLEGTIAFMSPEQAARAPLSPASDWYGVGVMLYQALTGRPPFVGDRDELIMAKVQHDPLPPVTVNADAPADLDALALRLLARDPGERPSAAALLAELGSDVQPRAHGSVTSTPAVSEALVGRSAQLAGLRAALAATRSGAPVLAHVRGPSGMGKSRILRAFLDEAAAAGALTLQGRCYERESMPFKAVDSLIDALTRHVLSLPALELEGLAPRDSMALARLFPVLRQVEAFTSPRRRSAVAPNPQELRRRAFGALRELLVRLADRQPLVVAIDDVQWGDADSAQLLASLLRPPDAPGVLVLLGHRSEDDEGSEFVEELAGVASSGIDVRAIEVGPLSADEAAQLARAHLPVEVVGRARLDRLVRESQGIPLFVEELARAAREEASVGGDAAPEMSGLLRARLTRLPEPAALLLSTIAIAGRPLPQELATRAAEVDDPAMLQLLKAASLVRTRLVAGTRVVECYHDRVRETATAVLTPAQIAERHHRLAVVHEASPSPDPEALALHLAGAGEPLRAAEFAVLAAERAGLSLAFERAAQLYRLALALDPARGRAVQVALGDALSHAGRCAEAAEAFLAAVEHATPAQALDLRGRAASQLLFAGHIDRGLGLLAEILDQIGMRMASTPKRAVASLLWRRALLKIRGLGFKERHESDLPVTQLNKIDVAFSVAEGLGAADPIRAADFHVRHLRLALDAGELKRVTRGLSAEVVFLSLRGVRMRARTGPLVEQVAEMAARTGDPGTLGLAAGCEGVVAFNEGRLEQASDALARAEQIFQDQCIGHRWEFATSRHFSLFAASLRGRVDEVTRRLPATLEEANARGDLYTVTTLQAALGFYQPLVRDDPDAAYRAIEAALARWSVGGYHLQHANALNSMCSIDLYVGDGARALGRIRAGWAALERSMLLRVEVMRSLLLATRARVVIGEAARTGDRALLAEAGRLGRTLAREAVDHGRGQGLAVLAACAAQRGEREPALALFAEAEAALERAELRLTLTCVRHAHGQLLGGADGAALIAAAEASMRGEGLVDPARVVQIFAPGVAAAR